MSQTLLQLRSVGFFVPGTPIPQGSMRTVPNMAKRRGKTRRGPDVFLVSDNPELKAWRNAIAGYARAQWPGPPTSNAVRLDVYFLFSRERVLANGKRQTLRGARPTTRTTGDRDKLLRAVQDALTKIVYDDDSRVVAGETEKRWAVGIESAGVLIMVDELGD